VLRFPLIHPSLLAALAACGHGGKVLIADANYSHSTNAHPRAALIHLNVRPGLVTVDDRRLHPAVALTIRRPRVPRTMIMGSFGRYGNISK
jgi:L-fucose mutarotase